LGRNNVDRTLNLMVVCRLQLKRMLYTVSLKNFHPFLLSLCCHLIFSS